MKKLTIILMSILLCLTFEVNAKSTYSSPSKSYSSPSKTYSFSSPSRSSSSSSLFSSRPSTPKPSSSISYESKRNTNLVQRGDSSAVYRSMDKQMADAGIKKKESVSSVERALNAPMPRAPVAPSVASSAPQRRYTTPVAPAPQQRQVIEHHYHNNDSGSGFVNGMIVGSLLNNHSSHKETVIINNGGNTQGSNVATNTAVTSQNCGVYDNDCVTSRYHFIRSVDF